MEPDLSIEEREALARFLVKVISDVDKVSALFESRGADAARPRAAKANLEATLAELSPEQNLPAKVLTYAHDHY